MTPALVLVDLQQDFLAAPELHPAAGQVIERAAALLHMCRRRNVPVIHVWTTVQREPDNRMPHWKSTSSIDGKGRWICERGTAGHQAPEPLRPLPGELIVHKQFFSGFSAGALHLELGKCRCDTLIFAGVHLHSCVRATALDAYARGYGCFIAEDAVASDDPVHAAITRRYLADRSIHFRDISSLLPLLSSSGSAAPAVYHHHSPADANPLWKIRGTSKFEIASRAAQLKSRWQSRDSSSPNSRAESLLRFASVLMDHQHALAGQITRDVGKPIRMARAEVARSAELLRAVAHNPAPADERSPAGTRIRHLPLGLIAIMTPWNNPLAIPIGKIAPALFYDNAVLWKPALPGSLIAQRLLELWRSVDPAVAIELVPGDRDASAWAASEPSVDAVTLSGSLAAGYALAEITARRSIPFQAELGGNNAAILAADADLHLSAGEIAAGALGFAGQRCTANRRVIVVGDHARLAAALDALTGAARNLPWGDPADEQTVIGPVISGGKRDQLLALVQRARDSGLRAICPHASPAPGRGAYVPPTLLVAEDPGQEIVREESFGPILVIQPAGTFDEALELLNGVRQGLAAACFTRSESLKQAFLSRAQAGILKINQSTSDADAHSPFGGWKSSGIGPPEHGACDREFFTRTQTVYGA